MKNSIDKHQSAFGAHKNRKKNEPLKTVISRPASHQSPIDSRDVPNTKKEKKGLCQAYCVPVIMMLTLNVVMLPALADAVNVNVAETELLAARTELSRFQVSVK